MKPKTSLVRSESIVELDTVSSIHVYVALIIHPGHFEGQNPVRFNETFNDACLFKLRIQVIHLIDGVKYFTYCLKIFYLPGILSFKIL